MASSIACTKAALRKSIRVAIQSLSGASVAKQSERIARQLIQLPCYARATSVSVYLEMGQREVATRTILQHALEANKRVFVPKVTGKLSDDMQMLQVTSLEEIDMFPKDKWGIPDPPSTTQDGKPRLNALETGDLQLIILPGVAFDRKGARLGHGGGYYDSFLRRLAQVCQDKGTSFPSTVGICLNCQLVDAVPMDSHDRTLDFVVTCDEIIDPTAPHPVRNGVSQ